MALEERRKSNIGIQTIHGSEYVLATPTPVMPNMAMLNSTAIAAMHSGVESYHGTAIFLNNGFFSFCISNTVIVLERKCKKQYIRI